jgi:FkbM family methyltransferase
MRRPLKSHSLQRLREMGVPVGTVIDIGILTGTHELMRIFGDRKQILIEPIVEWNDTIRKKYGAAGVDYELINVAAADVDGEMYMETSSVREGKPITHAQLTNKTQGENLRVVPVRTIDGLVAERNLPKPYLFKLDVDGVEMKILAGATAVLKDCSMVVIEANVRNYLERANYLNDHGFDLFDIVDPCYYDGRLRQFDLIFLSRRIRDEQGLDMYKQAFDINKWVVYR